MPYSLEMEEKCKKALAKAGSRNSELKKSVENKLQQILEDPYRFKPLRFPLQNKRRVHILKSFVMVFEALEKEKTVRVLDIDHHDNVYKS
ncbi:MAG TPA: type II toxin-antitoxin system RelE/ParE family toxin [archaeon]|nr:type II toxin-antitoxin system RelE/ParE family toxin [archaeon]